jgi:hypothetical protein
MHEDGDEEVATAFAAAGCRECLAVSTGEQLQVKAGRFCQALRS